MSGRSSESSALGSARSFGTLCLLLLAACGGASPPDRSVAAASDSGNAPPTDHTTNEATSPANIITPRGIGPVRLGQSIAALRASPPAGVHLGAAATFMVDLDGIPVIQDNDTLAWILVPAAEPPAADAVVEMMATTSSRMRTPEGVGPGTTLADAAAIYGAPTLSYNTNDESREYAAFPRLVDQALIFRVRPAVDSGAAGSTAGRYRTAHEYNETTDYDPAAPIFMVIVRRLD